MRKTISTIVGLQLLLLFPILQTSAQQSKSYDQPEADYRMAIELFEIAQFGASQKIFQDLDSAGSYAGRELKASARFYDAMCAAELSHANASYKIASFIQDYPEHSQAKIANFYLGRMYYQKNKYRDVLNAFQNVSPNDLNPAQREEYYFKSGYSYLKNNKPSQAKKYFERLIKGKSAYAAPAKYYYAHINYLEGNYETALQHFKTLQNDRTYKKIVPYYILQIHYYLEQYDAVIKEGPALVASSSRQKQSEAARITGDAFYRQEDYQNAVKYFEIYENTARKSISREDNYQLAYAYFMIQQYNNALDNFQKGITIQDEITQNSYYYLALCYVNTDQKKYAANAFLSAYKLDFDQEIREEALFDYAKLSIETSFNPYNEAITLLESYIRENPSTPRLDEAYGYLVKLYLSSRNFKQALTSIESIKNKNIELEKAYQQIAYSRGIEVFNDNDFEEAIALFKKSMQYDYNKMLFAEAGYWTGESFYRLGNDWAAIKYFNSFLKVTNTRQLEYYPMAYYILGYSHYNRKEYDDAVYNLKKFVSAGSGADVRFINDAYVRLGDVYFINKRYRDAITYYDKCITMGKSGTDYALLQKASSEGALGEYQKKIATLRVIPLTSRYHDDALYEIAISYLVLNQELQALDYFDRIIKQHPNSSFALKALMRSGLIQYNRNNYTAAINSLKKVIEKYPGTPESKEALGSLRNIYIDMDQVDQYYAYAQGISYADVSLMEQDSVTYMAAENRYMEGKCEQAIKSFGSYLEKFPQGMYAVNASFYKAECENKAGMTEQALQGYEFVIERPFSRFSETALVKAVSIVNAKDDCEQALVYYCQLEALAEYQENIIKALSGQMRCGFALAEYQLTTEAGRKLLSTDEVSEEMINEAHITLARSYFALDDLDLARFEYNITSKLARNEWAAEALYHLALIDYQTGHLTDAENEVFELADKYAAYDYWVAKGFILLADVYIKQDNIFQAKQTLQSIIDNYEGPELKKLASEKLGEIVNNEQE